MNTYPTTYYITDNGKEIEGVLVHADTITKIDQQFFKELSTDRYGSDYNCFLTLEEAKKLGIKPEDTTTTKGGYNPDDSAEGVVEEIAIANYITTENDEYTESGFLQVRDIDDYTFEAEFCHWTDDYCNWVSRASSTTEAVWHCMHDDWGNPIHNEKVASEILLEYEKERAIAQAKTDWVCSGGYTYEDILDQLDAMEGIKEIKALVEANLATENR